ncbi:MBG domain-containing protein [Wenyingzhuangia sp. IMCC45533]
MKKILFAILLSLYGTQFAYAQSIIYNGTGFTENLANDGSVTGNITATLKGDDFKTPLSLGADVTLTNIPTGLSPNISIQESTPTWTAQTAAEQNLWRSITYGNGLYVAVSATGANRVMTSPDGIIWTPRAAAENNQWASITYGNGLFVAVSSNGTNRVMTSNDGITWTPRAEVVHSFWRTQNFWRSVVYGNGLFVAVSSDGSNRVMTSLNGITWTARTAAENNQWLSVTYGNGLFVAVSFDGTNRVMTSPDGIAWTARTAAENNTWQSVTYGNGMFVAVSNTGSNRVMTSSDGITWTARTASENNQWNSVTYGNGLFVAVSQNGTNRVMISSDGITWTAQTAAEDNGWSSIAHGDNKFVAVSVNGINQVMTANPVSRATLTLTGNATSHANTNDVADIIFDFKDSAFNNSNASAVTNAVTASSNLGIDFKNSTLVNLSVSANTATEAVATAITVTATADNAVVGDQTIEVNVSGTTITNSDYTLSNATITILNGQTIGSTTFTIQDDTVVEGFETATLTLSNPSAGIALGSAISKDIIITDNDAEITYNSTGFTENLANDGSVTGNITATLKGDTFKTPLSLGTDVSLTNIPTGLNPNISVQRLASIWTARTAVQNNTWFSVAYGNGLFVAVSNSGTNQVMTSPDGITWTPRTAAENNQWLSVTYGNGLFVAVSSDGTNQVMTSTDGITWTPRAAAENNAWLFISYENGLFVAVSFNGANRVMTSPDGITWTSRTAAESNQWRSVTYGNGLFVAVSSNGTNRVMTSTDGITWTPRAAAENNGWRSVTYGNGLFVAVSLSGTNRVMTSPDGITWTARTAAENNQWRSVTYSNGLFVAISQNGTNRVMTSTDGITWTAQTAAENNGWSSVTYGDNKFVAVSFNGSNRVMTTSSESRATLTLTGNATNHVNTNDVTDIIFDFKDSAFNNSNANTVTNAVTASSNLGIDFKNPTLVNLSVSANTATEATPTAITVTATADNAVVGDQTIEVNVSGTAITSSDYTLSNTTITILNGQTIGSTTFTIQDDTQVEGFETATLTLSNPSAGIALGSAINKDIVITDNDAEITYNGTGFTENLTNDGSVTGNITATLKGDTFKTPLSLGTDVTLTNIPAGLNPNISVQEPASTWTAQAAAEQNFWRSVTYGNGLFVAVSSDGTNQVMTSPDGITWTPRAAAENNAWQSVTYGNGLFVAVSINGTNRVMTSPDGITWTPRAAVERNFWRSVTYGNGLFVAVSINGTNRVMTSPDGITWTPRTAAEKNQWRSVTYGNGLFVAVSQNGTNRVTTSHDGVIWTPRAAAEQNFWLSVTYGNGLFVAVSFGGTNRVMTSPDGITWTPRAAAEQNFWLSVTYGNGLFMAVSQNGTNRVMTSHDGITWTAQTAAENNEWNSVAYGDNKFVAVSVNGINRVMTTSSESKATFTLTGNAANHANTNDVADIIFDFKDSAFNNSNANTVTNAVTASSNLGIDFENPTLVNLSVSANTATEATPTAITVTATADNAVVGDQTIEVNVSGTTITNSDYTLSNATITILNGQTIGSTTFTIQDDTEVEGFETATLTLSNPSTGIALGSAISKDIIITDNDAEITYNGTGFTENLANDGSVTGNITATLKGDTFKTPLSLGTDVTLTNIPTGLNPIISVQQSTSNWTSPTAAQNNTWFSVAYGNGKFVALSNNGSNQVMTSPDGITWTPRASAENNQWRSVTYGNGLFVAVSFDGTNRVMTSPDGITWTPRTAAQNNSWSSITYGNGLFVAVSFTGTNRVMTSPDGITWTSRTAAENNRWLSVTYGNGLFVAVSFDGINRVMTSPDGITWTPRTAAESNQWFSVTYGNGLFVAVSTTGSNKVMISSDGITWTAQTAAKNNQWRSVTYGNGLFVAVSTTGSNRVMTSPDGITWTAQTAAENNEWSSVAYGDNKFVAVSFNGSNRVMTASSESRATLTLTGNATNHANTNDVADIIFDFKDSAFNNSNASTVTNAVTASSNLGIDFKNPTLVNLSVSANTATEATPTAITVTATADNAVVGDQTIEVNVSGTTITNSDYTLSNATITILNGQTIGSTTFTIQDDTEVEGFETATLTLSNPSTGIALGSAISKDIIITDNDAEITYNGTGFTENLANDGSVTGNITATLKGDTFKTPLSLGTDVTLTNIPTGLNPNISVQGPASTWAAQTAAENNQWRSVTYGNGLFVAVSINGTNQVMTSPDGITWTPRTAAENNEWGSVTYGNGLFVVVSSTGTNRVMTSPDGITWTARTAAENNAWSSVTYGNGFFVAVSFNGINRVMTSPDGITWTPQTAAGINGWQSVTYGSGLFVAISGSDTNQVMTSPDGITWTPRMAAENNAWSSITYGNGLFVAVSFSGTNQVMTSPDGITWTAQTAAENNSWFSVTYGNGLFVATSLNGTNRVMTSTDGITWTAQTAAENNQWISATYGDNKFVAVSFDGANRVMTASSESRAKLTLTGNAANHANINDVTDIIFDFKDSAFNNSNASTVTNAVTASSNLGIDFKNPTLVNLSVSANTATEATPTAITVTATADNTVVGDQTIEVNVSGTAITNSDYTLSNTTITILNGQTIGSTTFTIHDDTEVEGFETATLTLSNPSTGIALGSATSKDIIITDNDAEITYNGTGFTENLANDGSVTGNITATLKGDTFKTPLSLGTDVTLTNIPTGLSPNISVQGPASTWTAQTAAENNQWRSVTYGNGLFVAVSSDGTNQVMTSPDGITWTPRTAAENNEWGSVTYGNGLFVVVSSTGTNRVMTSPDGITWTARTAAENNQWVSVTYGNGLFVAVSFNGTNQVMTSPDGITWTSRTAAENNTWFSITYGNGLFVAVSFDGINRVMTSPDGITWTPRTAAENNRWLSVTYGNGLFVAVSFDGINRVMTSPDGITWTPRTAAENNQWRSVTYGNGLFVAVSVDGTNRVMTSTDGITWTAQTAAENNAWSSVAYGDNKFVAVSFNGSNRVMTASSEGRATLTLTGNAANHANTNDVADIIFDFKDSAFNNSNASTVTNAVTASSNLGIDFKNPTLVNLSVSANTVTEATPTAITVTATADNAVVGDQTIEVNVSGTAITNSDYTLSNATITILNGQTIGSTTFTIQDDTVVEGFETATLTLSNPSAGIALGSAISKDIVITDNDKIPLSITGLISSDKVYDGNTNVVISGTATLAGVVGLDDVRLSGTPIFTLSTASVGSAITINTTGYTLSGTDASKYVLTQPSLTANVISKTLTVTGLFGINKIYDGNTTAMSSGTATLSGIVGSDDVTLFGVPSFTFVNADAGLGISIATANYTLAGTDAANYSLTQPSLTADITKATLTATADDKNKVQGQANPTLTIAYTGFKNGDTLTDIDTEPSISTTAVVSSSTGNYPIILTGGSDDNYVFNLVNGVLKVGSLTSPTLTFNNITKTYGDADFNLQASSNSLGNISYSIIGNSNGTRLSGINNQIVTLGNAASVTLRATQDPSGIYSGGTKDITLSIAQRLITITADAKSKVYGDTDVSLTYQVASGTLLSGDVLAGMLTRAIGENVGTYAINQGDVKNPNYDITFTGANFTITKATLTATADDKNKVQGQANPTLTIAYTGFKNGDTLTDIDTEPSISTTAVVSSPTGNYPIILTGGSDDNYVFNLVNGVLKVGSLTSPTLTFNNITKTYGDADFNLQASSNSLGNISYSIIGNSNGTRLSGINNQIVTLGNAASVTLRATQDPSGIYSGGTKDITLSIAQRLITITADAKSKVYGDTDVSLTYQVASGTLLSGDVLAGMLTRAIGENVGTYAINQGDVKNPNYDITFTGANFTITKATLTATADDKNKVQGQANPTLTIAYTGFKNGDTLTDIDTEPSISTTAVVSSPTGNYPIILTGGSDDNYVFNLVNGVLKVGSLTSPTLMFNNVIKTYGDADFNLQASSNSLGNISYSIIGNPNGTRLSGINNQIVTLGNAVSVTLRATQNPNGIYSRGTKDITLSIVQHPITITADAKSKVIGTSDPALTYIITNGALIAGDVLNGNLSRAAGENIGTYLINQGNVDNLNYNITFLSANLEIIAASLIPITITADTQSKVKGTSDPILTYTITKGALVAGDVLNGSLSRAVGENIGTYIISQGTLENAKYDITFVSSVFTIINEPTSKTSSVNSFTPNGDGINDFFVIDGLKENFSNFELTIYTDFGVEIFNYRHRKNNRVRWWNGKNNRGEIREGVYYYIINYNDQNTKPKRSWVYLLK